jgi:hypothetical protein
MTRKVFVRPISKRTCIVLSRLWVVGVLIGGVTSCDSSVHHDNPLTYQEALKTGIELPLPASSHNITYYCQSEWQEYHYAVRFEAPLEDCIRQIPIVIAGDDKTSKRTSSYPQIRVTNVESIPNLPAWFDVQKITNGIYTGDSGSHKPQIWVDRARGVFYFLETD